VLLSASRTQVAGDIDELVNSHRALSGARTDGRRIPSVASVVGENETDRQTTLLVRTDGPISDAAWIIDRVSLEELVLAYLSHPDATTVPRPVVAATPREVHA
jgi:ABC-2 type transport system ATP-binding protein